jgi:hypothetical protein
MLSAQWAASTLAVLCPPDPAAADAGLTPVELWCELVNRGIHAVLAYSFADAGERKGLQAHVSKSLEKALLLRRGAVQMDAVLRAGGAGFGLLLHAPATVGDRVDRVLHALEGLFDRAGTPGDAFDFAKRPI